MKTKTRKRKRLTEADVSEAKRALYKSAANNPRVKDPDKYVFGRLRRMGWKPGQSRRGRGRSSMMMMMTGIRKV